MILGLGVVFSSYSHDYKSSALGVLPRTLSPQSGSSDSRILPKVMILYWFDYKLRLTPISIFAFWVPSGAGRLDRKRKKPKP